MLLQTNSYIVPKDKRAEHARLLRRFRASLAKLGCDSFEVYEQVGSNWTAGEPTGRYVQIMRFRDRRHQLSVQAAERSDPSAQAIIAEFCQLINFPYQQQQGLFAVGFYNSVLPVAPSRPLPGDAAAATAGSAAQGAPAVEPVSAEAPTDVAPEAVGFDEAEYEAVADDADGLAAAPGSEDTGDNSFDDETAVDADVVAPNAVSDTPEDELAVAEAEADSGADAAVDGAAEGHAESDVAAEADGVAGVEAEAEADVVAGAGDEREPAEAVAEDEQEPSAEANAPAGEAPRRREGDVAEGHLSEDASMPGDDVDELGALLDAHLQTEDGSEPTGTQEHPLNGPEGSADDALEGLDALDLDALDLPDEPAPKPRHASNHVAR